MNNPSDLLRTVEEAFEGTGQLTAARKRRAFGMVTLDYLDFGENNGTINFRSLFESFVHNLKYVRGVKVKSIPSKLSREGRCVTSEALEISYPNDLKDKIEEVYQNHLRLK
jgi:hypothetical protein